MQWDVLERQITVIKDVWPSFFIVCLVSIVAIYAVFRHRYKERIEDLKERVKELKERLTECEDAKKSDRPESQPSPELEIRYSDDYIQDRGDTLIYRIGVYNAGPVPANEVEVLITKIVPAPKAYTFRADFPYVLRGVDGKFGKRNINPNREEIFELCHSWFGDEFTIGGSHGPTVMIGGLDIKPAGEHIKFSMESDEVWSVHLQVSSANASMVPAILLFQPGTKAVTISRIDEP